MDIRDEKTKRPSLLALSLLVFLRGLAPRLRLYLLNSLGLDGWAVASFTRALNNPSASAASLGACCCALNATLLPNFDEAEPKSGSVFSAQDVKLPVASVRTD